MSKYCRQHYRMATGEGPTPKPLKGQGPIYAYKKGGAVKKVSKSMPRTGGRHR